LMAMHCLHYPGLAGWEDMRAQPIILSLSIHYTGMGVACRPLLSGMYVMYCFTECKHI